MNKINLRDVFPVYELDCYIEIPKADCEAFLACLTQEVAEVYVAFERAENAYQSRLKWHKAYFSLDANDGIEARVLSADMSPEDEYLAALDRRNLHNAILSLPEKHLRRIHAHFFLGLSMTDIAKKEKVHRSNITRSIKLGLDEIKNYLKKLD